MKKVLFLLCLVMMFGVVQADTFKLGDDIDLKVVCISSDDYCSNTATCNISVANPSNNYIVENVLMDNNNYYHNYTLNSTQITDQGMHEVTGICKDGAFIEQVDFTFDVTYSGKTITLQQMIYYIFIILSLIGLIYALIKTYQNLPNKNPTDDYGQLLSISHLKYLRIPIIGTIYWLFVAITFMISSIARAYFNELIVTNLFFTMFTILMRMSIPFIIVIFLYLLLEIFRDRELNNLMKRGLPTK